MNEKNETIADVLADERKRASSVVGNAYTDTDVHAIIDRIERALSAQPMAEYQVRPRSFGPDGEWLRVSKRQFDDTGEFPGFPESVWERRKLYATPQPAKPPAVDHDMAERAAMKVCEYSGETWANLDDFTKSVLIQTQFAALTAAQEPSDG